MRRPCEWRTKQAGKGKVPDTATMVDQSLNVIVRCFCREVTINNMFVTLVTLLISSGNSQSEFVILCNNAKATMGHAVHPRIPIVDMVFDFPICW
jgi:hypothetical protein